MERYRIVTGEGYNGCIPITLYWVQVRVEGFFCDSWRNVKGFENYERAEQLIEMLEE